MKRKALVCFLAAVLYLLPAAAGCADAVARMHYVFLNWVGEYTGQVDSGNIPFGFGIFESSTTIDGETWHYIGSWENGLPEGEGSIYYDNGNMDRGTFTAGELTDGLKYSVTGLAAVPVKTERTIVESEAAYIGNKNSMRFHLPTCRAVTQMKESNKIEFFSREEAIERNYIPCGECNP